MKKIVIFLLVNLIIMSTLCVSAAVRNIGDIYKSKDGQFRVQIRDDETLMIHKYLGDSDKLIIPDKIDGVKVTRIRGDGIPITVKSIKLGKNIDYVTSTRLAARKNIEEITVDTNNKYFYSKDGVLYNKEKTKVIAYPANRKQTKISILNSVKYIGKYAFTGNRNLKTIEIGKNIISVGEEAFCGCKCAETVIIPKNVKIIGKNAFADCKKLTNIKISGSKKLVINDFAFSDNTALKKVRFPIYNDENSGTSFFLFCNHLKNVTISKGVRSIPISCFNGC